MDRGYFDFERLYILHQCSSFFVVRAKASASLQRVYSMPVDTSCGLRCDQIVLPASFYARKNYLEKLRRVVFVDEDKDIRLNLLTNQMTLPALTIAELYRYRWQVELFFKWIKLRLSLRVKKIFLVQKGTHKGKPLSVRGIQKRMEYYAKKAGLPVSCHQLRHTMATQLLNADADLVSIQDLLGHSRIKTTQRYCRVSNLKVQRDYFKAIEEVIKRTTMNNNFT